MPLPPPGAVLASGIAAVNEALKAVPPDKHAAVLVSARVEAGRESVLRAVAVRKGKDWNFYAEAETDWKDRHAAEIGILWTP